MTAPPPKRARLRHQSRRALKFTSGNPISYNWPVCAMFAAGILSRPKGVRPAANMGGALSIKLSKKEKRGTAHTVLDDVVLAFRRSKMFLETGKFALPHFAGDPQF